MDFVAGFHDVFFFFCALLEVVNGVTHLLRSYISGNGSKRCHQTGDHRFYSAFPFTTPGDS